jgi:hypothetical protein
VITVNVDDLESIQLNQKEEKEEEMNKLDSEEDKQTFVL